MRALSGRSRISYPMVMVFNLLRKTTKVGCQLCLNQFLSCATNILILTSTINGYFQARWTNYYATANTSVGGCITCPVFTLISP
ncbi:MAG: hypothetical protein WBP84_02070, partial [Nitrososphaeraceae archaeon]